MARHNCDVVTGLRSGIRSQRGAGHGGVVGIWATGPLAVHVEGFRAALAGMGYTPRTARDHGYVLVHLSRWLVAERVGPWELT